MATQFNAISRKGRYLENWQETFYVSGSPTQADIGKLVTIDTSAEKTVKLAGDGDEVFGRLEILENRVQEGTVNGTVAMKFLDWVPTTATVPAIGDAVVGGGAGQAKTLASTSLPSNKVLFRDTTNHRVYVKFG